jgi:DNA polymerase III delta prime subunit
MESILDIHIQSGDFHHGYLLVGDFEISRNMALEATRAILKPEGKIEAHPDFSHQKFELLGIEESRDLTKKASQRPFVSDKKVFIIELFSFSLESANALLKTLEEPYPGTHFFVIVPSLENVIPTLVSRLTVIDNSKIKKELSEEKIKFYKKFLSDLPNKRLETIKKFMENRQEAIEFLSELELITKKDFKVLEEIQRCKSFLFSQGASAKIVLEHIALALPQM